MTININNFHIFVRKSGKIEKDLSINLLLRTEEQVFISIILI